MSLTCTTHPQLLATKSDLLLHRWLAPSVAGPRQRSQTAKQPSNQQAARRPTVDSDALGDAPHSSLATRHTTRNPAGECCRRKEQYGLHANQGPSANESGCRIGYTPCDGAAGSTICCMPWAKSPMLDLGFQEQEIGLGRGSGLVR